MIFTDIFDDVTKKGTKIPTNQYLTEGLYPIIDQGQSDISGYTNEEKGLFTDVPAIIFGDHTRVIKYVDKPCFLGADGVKLLKAKERNANYKYLYYALSNAKIPNTGYNRHFKWLKEVNIPMYSEEKQAEIVAQLEKVDSLIFLRKQQLSKLDELVKARFVEMFGDPVSNSMRWKKDFLGKRCNIITGNTPPRTDAENYGHFIEWIKSDNINTPESILTQAEEYLSEKGSQIGRIVDSGSVLMTCIAGSLKCIGNVGIANRRVAFNQQINAIVPRFDETMYIYWLMIQSKPYIHRSINMALKGILSKSQLSALVFPFPPIDLQRQFTAFVKQADKLKSEIQSSLEKFETLKKVLMQKYFG